MDNSCIEKESVQECQLWCQQTELCVRFSYTTKLLGDGPINMCCLKAAQLAEIKSVEGVISGPVYCPREGESLVISNMYAV